ncbi:MAG: carboxy terminal-processing peptidase [Deltaproteobacteria bacterium]|nr:carboxy terminal-processing peptidase [Deltaproteobacteria bacterium]MBW2421004.1 carboxy terminal-processing peptidase [Deltaproteobacteria bacterium]
MKLQPHPIHRRLLALAVLAAALVVLWGGGATAAELTCERVPELLRTYLHKHIRFHYLNDELRERAIDAYVKRMDPSKTLLLASDAKQLKQSLAGIFHDVRSGDCEQIEQIQKDLRARVKAMELYVTKTVSRDDYEVDSSVELVIDPEKRGYPRTVEQQHELYDKLIHFQISNYVSTDIELDEAKSKLIHRYELISKRAEERTPEDLYASFLDSFATALDPHSNYLSAEVLEDFQIGMGLSLEGIGVALSSRDGYSVVEKIIPGGAADQADILRPKDKVIAVAQEEGETVDVIDMDLRDVVRLIRGKRGTKVHLTVLRQDESTERFVVTIVRDKINLEEQAASIRFEPAEINGKSEKLAIIELPSFYGGRDPADRQSSDDLRKLLEEAKKEKAAGVLLDLSRNGGGLLDTAIEIAGFFIREGGVVAVKDTFGKIQILRDPDANIIYDGPLVVLTSRVSASASEIVAGAMKDYNRAILVGDDHTFGKGTVQSMVPLPTGLGALKVTTAVFFRPGGDSTQHSGVASDVQLPSVFNTDDFGEAYQTYSLEPQAITPFLDGSANVNQSRIDDSVAFEVVTPKTVARLSELSAQRVAENEEFAEIQRKLEETKERNGVVHLADIIKENEASKQEEQEETTEKAEEGGPESGQKQESKDAEAAATQETAEQDAKEEEEDVPSVQQVEALQILADYVRLLSEADAPTLAADSTL